MQTEMSEQAVCRGLILLILVIPQLFLKCHNQVKLLFCPVLWFMNKKLHNYWHFLWPLLYFVFSSTVTCKCWHANLLM